MVAQDDDFVVVVVAILGAGSDATKLGVLAVTAVDFVWPHTVALSITQSP